MKHLLLTLLSITLAACSVSTPPVETITLPVKSDSLSTSMVDSPITTSNLDTYMFVEKAFYVDTRNIDQIFDEGSIAGFSYIPFYELIANLHSQETLYTMKQFPPTQDRDRIHLGDPGSFVANFEESDQVIRRIFPKNTPIFVISTAGVEATYLLNLLVQLGYDSSLLYNVGPFSNTVGNQVAYRLIRDAKYYLTPLHEIRYIPQFDLDSLTPITIAE